ncbi:hypothetical protein AMD27_04390 [Acinetobacter sp. TGL-Y2]|uniref:hypothetical protein n=1 Tax=Acinetobacter sp. TGL-Y2 TaxID=1407071 RepID=UPI0007A658A4|nr:hypothetical protein [Acinetobacter sp. TGL-Y2]AMW78208.1 hypothetical protein AMD27_04390 [Acinetobacter sp. TGL-Y2]
MAGGSQIIINKNGITFITPAKFEAKAGQHLFKGGAKVITKLPFLPESQQNSLRYRFVDDDSVPYGYTQYTAYYENGREVKGVTDKDGFTQTLYSSNPQELKIHLEI